MCGLIGILSGQQVAPLIVEALRRLEYRGYDSAGVATLVNGHITRRRAEGKLVNLEARLAEEPLYGTTGIGHTRWATHGKPSERNAHPMATDRVAVVHNGIIENHVELRKYLEHEGCHFESDTDTETIAQMITWHLNRQMTPQDAFLTTLQELRGAFAVAVIFTSHHNLMMGARQGSSLAVGYGTDEMYLGTDAIALAPFTQQVSYLEEGDVVTLTRTSVSIWNNGRQVKREVKNSGIDPAMTGKGGYPHFMLKEIYEQPGVVGDTLQRYLSAKGDGISMPDMPFDWNRVQRISFLACGTSAIAGQIAKYWFARLAQIHCDTDVASESRYMYPVFRPGDVCIAISQSGETMDTMQALLNAKKHGQHIIGIVNVPDSAISRESHVTLPTLAGPEIAVASTKAFTTQLVVLLALAISAGRARGIISAQTEQDIAKQLILLPSLMQEVISDAASYRKIAETILSKARDVLYLGRGTSFPVAMEGALKLKEISYIHAEGYAGGEMKHGPIALIDEAVPVVLLIPRDELFEKTGSNLEQVRARGGKPILISDKVGVEQLGTHAAACITLPSTSDMNSKLISAILYTVVVQLLAYYTAVAKGIDLDQPRNLAKSVTVE